MRKGRAKRNIRQSFIDGWIVEFPNCQQDDVRGISNHRFGMVVEPRSHIQQGEILLLGVGEKLDGGLVQREHKRLEE
jgi:hypothetical protein